jgi:hypothetical protein
MIMKNGKTTEAEVLEAMAEELAASKHPDRLIMILQEDILRIVREHGQNDPAGITVKDLMAQAMVGLSLREGHSWDELAWAANRAFDSLAYDWFLYTDSLGVVHPTPDYVPARHKIMPQPQIRRTTRFRRGYPVARLIPDEEG